jgi:hypothetical protein
MMTQGNATIIKIGEYPGDYVVKLDGGPEVSADGSAIAGYGSGPTVGTRCKVQYAITDVFDAPQPLPES